MTPTMIGSLSAGTLQMASRMAKLGAQMDILQRIGYLREPTGSPS